MTRACRHFSIVVAVAMMLSAGSVAGAQEAAAPHVAEIKKLGAKFLAKGFKSSWSPDGKRIVFGRGIPGTKYDTTGGLMVLDLAAGKTTLIVKIGKDPLVLAGVRTLTFDPQTPGLLVARMLDGTTLRGQLVEKTLAVTITSAK